MNQTGKKLRLGFVGVGSEQERAGRPRPATPAVRETLQRRKLSLETELAYIRKLLNGQSVPAKIISLPIGAAGHPQTLLADRYSNRGLSQAITNLLAGGPMTKDQLVEKLLAQDFKFFGKPRAVLDTVLYTRKFRRQDKLFRLAI